MKLLILLFLSTACFAQPAEFKFRLKLQLSDTIIEGVTHNRRLIGTELQYKLEPSHHVVVRGVTETYRGTTKFFENSGNERLSDDIEIIADTTTMVDSLGNIKMSYDEYRSEYFDDTLQVWKQGTPRWFNEFSWYQFISTYQPVIIHQAILQAMNKWAIRRKLI